MADEKKRFIVKESNSGSVKISDEVIAIIASLAATETDGVLSITGGITNDIVSKIGINKLSKGVGIAVKDENVRVGISLNLKYGYEIPKVTEQVQEKVKYAIETMTGLNVTEVNINVSSVASAE